METNQHPTDGTPIKESAPVNNDNDGKTTAPADTGETAADKLRKYGNWNPEASGGDALKKEIPTEVNNNPPENLSEPDEFSAPQEPLVGPGNVPGDHH